MNLPLLTFFDTARPSIVVNVLLKFFVLSSPHTFMLPATV
jgi:hypothetical protein